MQCFSCQRPTRTAAAWARCATSRLVAKDAECAKLLTKRTLTNLYNQRPTWLDLAHRKLDEVVFAAYGWKTDLSDEDILGRLLELNLRQKAAE